MFNYKICFSSKNDNTIYNYGIFPQCAVDDIFAGQDFRWPIRPNLFGHYQTV